MTFRKSTIFRLALIVIFSPCSLKRFVMSFFDHIDEMAKMISKAINGLKQVRPFVHFHLYNAVILPLFDYCDVVWGNLKDVCGNCLCVSFLRM